MEAVLQAEDVADDDDDAASVASVATNSSVVSALLAEKPAPISFSQVDPLLPHEQLQTQFPEFSKATPIFCDIHEGKLCCLFAYHNNCVSKIE